MRAERKAKMLSFMITFFEVKDIKNVKFSPRLCILAEMDKRFGVVWRLTRPKRELGKRVIDGLNVFLGRPAKDQ